MSIGISKQTLAFYVIKCGTREYAITPCCNLFIIIIHNYQLRNPKRINVKVRMLYSLLLDNTAVKRKARARGSILGGSALVSHSKLQKKENRRHNCCTAKKLKKRRKIKGKHETFRTQRFFKYGYPTVGLPFCFYQKVRQF